MEQDARDLSAALQCGADGHAAFARIFDRHSPVVLALCRQHLGGRHEPDAADALQETFIRAYRMLDRLAASGGADRLRPWLYGIARRVCAERRRAAGRRSHHEQEAAMNHTINRGASGAGTALAPSDAADQSEQLHQLTRALECLPDSERLAIHLYYLDPDPVKAASSALGLSRSGFYKLLARAREHLGLLMSAKQPT